jgi:hypothetical protein
MKEELFRARTMADKLKVVADHYDLTQPLPSLTARMVDSQLQSIVGILKFPPKKKHHAG